MNAVLSLRTPRSARVLAVTLLWITRTLTSLLVVCPVLFAISGSGLVSGPERDAVLFRPGSLLLLELVRAGAALLGSALKSSLVLGVSCAVLGLAPLGLALDLLQSQDADALAARFARAVRRFPGFLVLSGITLLAQGAFLLAASLLGTALSAALSGRDERVLTLTPIVLFGVALLGCAWLGALLDVARGLLVERDLHARAALLEALGIVRDEPLAVLVGFYPSVAGSLFAWLCAAWLLTKIDLAQPTTRGVALAFVVHQSAVLLSITLRVRWLGAAIALGARAESARD
ncbi:MAG TPA: hypothetical protein VNW92_12010 [Polyangiaceae bacterium]|nr:hypothetical protein [Polyangiaceae bacterium]